ncbi:MAG: hypothetical protein EOM45_14605 [Clostridia bacterium]|nr:hypothetical protein [Clostridia bacterium]
MVRYGDTTTPITKSNTGQILFMKDQGFVYDMRDKNTDGTVSTSTDVSIEIDFSNALNYNFVTSKSYWLKVCLYRTADPDYPLNGNPVQTLMIPIEVESDKEYGYRMDVDNDQLNVNLYNTVSDGQTGTNVIPDLSFDTLYSNVSDNNENTSVRYSLYKRDAAGVYQLCTDDAALHGLSLGMDYGAYTLSEAFSGGTAKFSLWHYSLNGSDTESAYYTSGEDTVTVGTVAVTISNNRITGITATKDGSAVAGMDSIINAVIAANGVSGISQSMTLTQKAVFSAIKRILLRSRTGATIDGTGTSAMAISGFSGDLPLGNYKIVGGLYVNNIQVASDYFIFNVNKNLLYDPIQS